MVGGMADDNWNLHFLWIVWNDFIRLHHRKYVVLSNTQVSNQRVQMPFGVWTFFL
jgi:hypothetical protein